jgi:uncharacterized protein (DUF58 family)
LPELTASKLPSKWYQRRRRKEGGEGVPAQKRVVLRPRSMGVFILLLIVLSFAAGYVRGEMVLTLTGAVFLCVWLYCLAMILLLAAIHSRRAGRVSIRIIPAEIAEGGQAHAVYSENTGINTRVIQFPGILVRCNVLLNTADGRSVTHEFRAGSGASSTGQAAKGQEFFNVKKRGAYFSQYDEFAVFDILGLFRFAFRIPQEPGVRLLAAPCAAESSIPVNARSGESNLQAELTLQRTDILIDHRPYVPGDDPRRINWKLYGHGGELFVREGERERPPHSNIVILIDSQYDPELYSPKAARRTVDLLCENALAAAIECADSGLNVQIGGNARKTAAVVKPEEIASALAWSAALPLSVTAPFGEVTAGQGIVIFAMPKATSQPSAIDHFLQGSGRSGNNSASIDIIFMYSTDGEAQAKIIEERAAAAETCAALYNQHANVRARAVRA